MVWPEQWANTEESREAMVDLLGLEERYIGSEKQMEAENRWGLKTKLNGTILFS